MELTKLSKTDCWLPGASIWVTHCDSQNPWLSVLDYYLNFQISKILQITKQRHSANSNTRDLLLIAPQSMLPTELVVILNSWKNIDQLNQLKFPYQTTTVRLFNPEPNLTFSEELKTYFQFEWVPIYE